MKSARSARILLFILFVLFIFLMAPASAQTKASLAKSAKASTVASVSATPVLTKAAPATPPSYIIPPPVPLPPRPLAGFTAPPASPLNHQLGDITSPFALSPVTISQVEQTITEVETQGLQSYNLNDISGVVNINQYFRFSDTGNPFTSTGQVKYTANSAGTLDDYLTFQDTTTMFEYETAFAGGFQSAVDNATKDLTNLEGQSLTILTKPYYIAETQLVGTQLTLTLVNAPYQFTINQGVTQVVSVRGSSVSITVNSSVNPSGDGSADFIINGVPFTGLVPGVSATLPGIGNFALLDVIAGSPNQVVLGFDTTIVILNDNTADTLFSATVNINGNFIEDASVLFQGNMVGPDFNFGLIKYRLNSDASGTGNTFIAEARTLSSQLDEPQGMLKGWDMFYSGLEPRNMSPFMLDANGDDSYSLRFINTQGTQYAMPLADNSNSGGLGFNLGNADNALKFVEANNACDFANGIVRNDYFVLTDPITKVSRVLQYTGFNPVSGEVTFTDLGTGPLPPVPFAGAFSCGIFSYPEGDLVIGGSTFHFYIDDSGVGVITFDYNKDGLINNGEANIYLQSGQVLDLNNNAAGLSQQEPLVTQAFNISITTPEQNLTYSTIDEKIIIEIQPKPLDKITAQIKSGITMVRDTGHLVEEGLSPYGIFANLTGYLPAETAEITMQIPDHEQTAGVWITFGSAARACGDINNDGAVTILDALFAAKHAAGSITLGGSDFACGDVDTTAAVTILDSLKIAQSSAGLPVTLTCSAACQ